MLNITEILESLKLGKISISKAQKQLSLHSIEKIEDFAKIDLGRKLRRGIPEVIFAEKKSALELKKIITKSVDKLGYVLLSRVAKKDYDKIISFSKKKKIKIKFGKKSTSLLLYKKRLNNSQGKVGILTAGTSDIGVAEEARLMCEAMNCSCICSYDVGIAGLHRVFPMLKKMLKDDVDTIIVVAGMDGALPTIVSSLVNIPVIGVPTSVGYGYGEKGVAALATMLQSCSLGLSVVNIDNGIGAGAIAASIANRTTRNSRG